MGEREILNPEVALLRFLADNTPELSLHHGDEPKMIPLTINTVLQKVSCVHRVEDFRQPETEFRPDPLTLEHAVMDDRLSGFKE